METTKLKTKIANRIYKTSKKPLSFQSLMSANSSLNEGMLVDASLIGYRVNLSSAYAIYALLSSCVMIPVLGLLHVVLDKDTPHLSMLITAIITSCVFIGFNYFLSHMRDFITLSIIKKAWLVHLPFFAFEEYSKKADTLYSSINDKEESVKNLRQYITDGLMKDDKN